MYQCPSCGGNLKFNIEKQSLYCEFCSYETDPYKIDNLEMAKGEDASGDEYEVTVFHCPQCGAEILSEDTTAATFCSFCGSTTVLESRISKEKRPAYILPFKKTKEDCKEAYEKMMKRAIFVPKEYKDPEHIEKFRGIYMPYWDYQFQSNFPFQFWGSKSKRTGDYIDSDIYNVECDLEFDYKGIFFDASSTFADHLSESIAPFELKDEKEFTPAYLSGFYADINDVSQEVYAESADKIVIKDIIDRAQRDSSLVEYEITDYPLERIPISSFKKSKLVMLPVWFLSYRKGDRVSYAVVNGQTGEIAADLPVDIKKYLRSSLLLSVIIFLVLNMLYTFTPGKLLGISAILAICSFIASNIQMTDLIVKDFGLDDMGKMSAGLKEKKSFKTRQRTKFTFEAVIFLCVYFFVLGWLVEPFRKFIPMLLFITIMYGCCLGGVKVQFTEKSWRNMKLKLPVLIKPILGILSIVIMLLIHPVYDGWYYLSALFSLFMTGLSAIDLMRYHNKLVSRKLPQFNKRGGAENE